MFRQFLRFAQRLRARRSQPNRCESRVAAVALLVDGENIAAEFAVHLLAHAGKFGGISYCRVYGNWAAPTMQRWQEMATHYGMVPEHQYLPVAGKNATDIALVVDAMDIFHSGVRRFCLASGDSDYTPLVRRLVEQGCVVVVIGRPDTALILQQACTVFISTEQLQPLATRTKISPASVPPTPASADGSAPVNANTSVAIQVGPENLELQTLLVTAYHTVVAEKGNDWVALNQLGTALRRINPNYTHKAYGSATLKGLILKHATVFQVEETSGGQAHIKLKVPDNDLYSEPETERHES